jgi:PST family polysaccharide transporter
MGSHRLLLSGFFWISLGEGAPFLLQSLSVLVLARLLFPQDFALVAAAYPIIGVLHSLKSVGLTEAVIQDQRLDPKDISTAFLSTSAAGAALCALNWAAAPLAADFFTEPRLVGILRLLGWGLLIESCAGIPRALILKRLDYRSFIVPAVAGAAAQVSVSILLAWRGAGPWALVWGSVANSATLAALSWLIAPSWLPRHGFSARRLFRLSRFSIPVLGTSVLKQLLDNVDLLLVAKILGPEQLGFYFMAQRIARQILSAPWTVLYRVLFPAASSAADPAAVRGLYRTTAAAAAAALWPGFLVLSLLSAPAIQLLCGEKWLPSAAPFAALCILALLRSATNSPVSSLYALGRSEQVFSWMAESLLWKTLGCATGLGLGWGTVGAAGGAALGALAALPSLLRRTNSVLGLSWSDQAGVFGPALAACLAALVLPLACRLARPTDGIWMSAALLTAGGIYAGVLMAAWRRTSLPMIRPHGHQTAQGQ